MQRRRTGRALMAPLLALAMVAGACSGDDSDGDDAGAGDDAATESASQGDGQDDGQDDGDGGDRDGGDDTESGDEPAADGADVVRGGTLTVPLESESDTWDIPGASCAVSCITVMRAVADPLTMVNADGEIEPFLLESFEHNDDFTEFTLTMRPGVTFHDGTPADGAALQRNFQEMAGGLLQRQVLADLVDGADGVELVDDMTVRMAFSKPFATFGNNIAERTGWLLAPSFWDDPDRAGALPVGTGPFRMTEWSPDDQTVLEAYEGYWREGADGVPLPYLDSIVFRPNADAADRRAIMEAGDADVNHDTTAANLPFWRDEWAGGVAPAAPDTETTYLLINNAVAPFDDVEFRRALAHCTDRNEYITFLSPGFTLANGPFADGALGYLADPGFPDFDPAAGSAILDEIGRPDQIVYGTSNDPSNVLAAELFADMWSTNCGLTVDIDEFLQRELIGKAITGGFQILLWRNHGQVHPGLEYAWWHSRHAAGLATNFGRITDPELDALLDQTWTTDDPAELAPIAEDINRLFAENVYNIWLTHTPWEIAYAPGVRGVGQMTLPSGSSSFDAIAGRMFLAEVWKEG